MKFKLVEQKLLYLEKDRPKMEELGFKFVPESRQKVRYSTSLYEYRIDNTHDVFVEINTLEELTILMKKCGDVIISDVDKTITIAEEV